MAPGKRVLRNGRWVQEESASMKSEIRVQRSHTHESSSRATSTRSGKAVSRMMTPSVTSSRRSPCTSKSKSVTADPDSHRGSDVPSPLPTAEKVKSDHTVDERVTVSSKEDLDKFIAEEMCLDETYLVEEKEKKHLVQESKDVFIHSNEITEKSSCDLSCSKEKSSTNAIEPSLVAQKANGKLPTNLDETLSPNTNKKNNEKDDVVEKSEQIKSDAAFKRISSMIREKLEENEKSLPIIASEDQLFSKMEITSTSDRYSSSTSHTTEHRVVHDSFVESQSEADGHLQSFTRDTTHSAVSSDSVLLTEGCHTAQNPQEHATTALVSSPTCDNGALDNTSNNASKEIREALNQKESEQYEQVVTDRSPVHVVERTVTVEDKGAGRQTRSAELKSTAAEAGSRTSLLSSSSNCHQPRCICQICECGRHRCPHTVTNQRSSHISECLVSEWAQDSTSEQRFTTTSRESFSSQNINNMRRPHVFKQEDHLFASDEGVWLSAGAGRGDSVTGLSHMTSCSGLGGTVSECSEMGERCLTAESELIVHEDSFFGRGDGTNVEAVNVSSRYGSAVTPYASSSPDKLKSILRHSIATDDFGLSSTLYSDDGYSQVPRRNEVKIDREGYFGDTPSSPGGQMKSPATLPFATGSSRQQPVVDRRSSGTRSRPDPLGQGKAGLSAGASEIRNADRSEQMNEQEAERASKLDIAHKSLREDYLMCNTESFTNDTYCEVIDESVGAGEFVGRPNRDVPVGQRAPVVKHQDHLTQQGDFVDSRERTAPMKGERAHTIKHPDNLKIDGEFDKRPQAGVPKGERAPMVKHSDHLTVDGVFEGRPVQKAPIAEKQTSIKYKDNLKPEGDFVQRSNVVIGKSERTFIANQKNNIECVGDFSESRHAVHASPPPLASSPILASGSVGDDSKVHRGKRSFPAKQMDNLRLEGEFEGRRTVQRSTKHQRTPAHRPVDILKVEVFDNAERQIAAQSSSSQNKFIKTAGNGASPGENMFTDKQQIDESRNTITNAVRKSTKIIRKSSGDNETKSLSQFSEGAGAANKTRSLQKPPRECRVLPSASDSPVKRDSVDNQKHRHVNRKSSKSPVQWDITADRSHNRNKQSANEDHIKGILFQDTLRTDSSYTDMRRQNMAVVRGERCQLVRPAGNIKLATVDDSTQRSASKGPASSRAVSAQAAASAVSCQTVIAGSSPAMSATEAHTGSVSSRQHSAEYRQSSTAVVSAAPPAASPSPSARSTVRCPVSREERGLVQQAERRDQSASVCSASASLVQTSAVSGHSTRSTGVAAATESSRSVSVAGSRAMSAECVVKRTASAAGTAPAASESTQSTSGRHFVDSLRREDEVRRWSAHTHRQHSHQQRQHQQHQQHHQQHHQHHQQHHQHQQHHHQHQQHHHQLQHRPVAVVASSERSQCQSRSQLTRASRSALAIHGDYDAFRDSAALKNRNYAVYKPCPASAIDSPMSNMRLVHTARKHTFYMPKVSD